MSADGFAWYGKASGGPFKDWRTGIAYVVEVQPGGKCHFLYEDGTRELADGITPYDSFFLVWTKLRGPALPAWCKRPAPTCIEATLTITP